MRMDKWRDLLLPEQIEFFTEIRGHVLSHYTLFAPDNSLEYSYFLDEGFWAYVNGEFYEHVEEDNWEQYAAELEENGTERVVLLDFYGDILHETQKPHMDTPKDVKYHGLDILNVMLPYHTFSKMEDNLFGNILRNEEESKQDRVLSLSASELRDEKLMVDYADSDIVELLIWLRWKVQMLPQVNEVRIAVWS